MKFLIIRPDRAAVDIEDYKDTDEARQAVGLKNVDFGSFSREHHIIVYEFGLLEPEKHRHFSIGTRLFAGNAVLFMTDEAGDTTDWTAKPPPVMFYTSIEQVERAIQAGQIERPETAINGVVISRWPELHLPKMEDFDRNIP